MNTIGAAQIDAPHDEAQTRLTYFERTLALSAVAAIGAVWAIAFSLTPDPSGVGTHEQLGLAPCQLVTVLGIPCAFCGMTTSFTHLAQGDPWQALITQPAAVAIAAATIPAALIALAATLTGRVPGLVRRWALSRPAFAIAAILLVAAWVYKIFVFI